MTIRNTWVVSGTLVVLQFCAGFDPGLEVCHATCPEARVLGGPAVVDLLDGYGIEEEVPDATSLLGGDQPGRLEEPTCLSTAIRLTSKCEATAFTLIPGMAVTRSRIRRRLGWARPRARDRAVSCPCGDE